MVLVFEVLIQVHSPQALLQSVIADECQFLFTLSTLPIWCTIFILECCCTIICFESGVEILKMRGMIKKIVLFTQIIGFYKLELWFSEAGEVQNSGTDFFQALEGLICWSGQNWAAKIARSTIWTFLLENLGTYHWDQEGRKKLPLVPSKKCVFSTRFSVNFHQPVVKLMPVVIIDDILKIHNPWRLEFKVGISDGC